MSWVTAIALNIRHHSVIIINTWLEAGWLSRDPFPRIFTR